KEDSIVGVLDRVLLVIMCCLVLWTNTLKTPVNINIFVGLQTLSYLITLFIVIALVSKNAGLPSLKWQKKTIVELLKKSLPYASLVLLMSVYYRTDSIMIEQLLPNGKQEAALYAQGFRFLEAFNMIGFLFAGLLLPIFAKMIAQKEDLSAL